MSWHSGDTLVSVAHRAAELAANVTTYSTATGVEQALADLAAASLTPDANPGAVIDSLAGAASAELAWWLASHGTVYAQAQGSALQAGVGLHLRPAQEQRLPGTAVASVLASSTHPEASAVLANISASSQLSGCLPDAATQPAWASASASFMPAWSTTPGNASSAVLAALQTRASQIGAAWFPRGQPVSTISGLGWSGSWPNLAAPAAQYGLEHTLCADAVAANHEVLWLRPPATVIAPLAAVSMSGLAMLQPSNTSAAAWQSTWAALLGSTPSSAASASVQQLALCMAGPDTAMHAVAAQNATLALSGAAVARLSASGGSRVLAAGPGGLPPSVSATASTVLLAGGSASQVECLAGSACWLSRVALRGPGPAVRVDGSTLRSMLLDIAGASGAAAVQCRSGALWHDQQSHVHHNTAGCVQADSSVIHLNGTTFTACSAPGNGAGVSVQGTDAVAWLAQVSWRDVAAGQSGGAMAVSGARAHAFVHDIQVTNASAGIAGAGFAVHGGAQLLAMGAVQFADTRAACGAAMQVGSGPCPATLDFDDVTSVAAGTSNPSAVHVLPMCQHGACQWSTFPSAASADIVAAQPSAAGSVAMCWPQQPLAHLASIGSRSTHSGGALRVDGTGTPATLALHGGACVPEQVLDAVRTALDAVEQVADARSLLLSSPSPSADRDDLARAAIPSDIRNSVSPVVDYEPGDAVLSALLQALRSGLNVTLTPDLILRLGTVNGSSPFAPAARLSDSSAGRHGGGVAAHGSEGYLLGQGLLVSNASSAGHGGAVAAMSGAALRLSQVSVTSTVATQSGGAVAIDRFSAAVASAALLGLRARGTAASGGGAVSITLPDQLNCSTYDLAAAMRQHLAPAALRSHWTGASAGQAWMGVLPQLQPTNARAPAPSVPHALSIAVEAVWGTQAVSPFSAWTTAATQSSDAWQAGRSRVLPGCTGLQTLDLAVDGLRSRWVLQDCASTGIIQGAGGGCVRASTFAGLRYPGAWITSGLAWSHGSRSSWLSASAVQAAIASFPPALREGAEPAWWISYANMSASAAQAMRLNDTVGRYALTNRSHDVGPVVAGTHALAGHALLADWRNITDHACQDCPAGEFPAAIAAAKPWWSIPAVTLLNGTAASTGGCVRAIGAPVLAAGITMRGCSAVGGPGGVLYATQHPDAPRSDLSLAMIGAHVQGGVVSGSSEGASGGGIATAGIAQLSLALSSVIQCSAAQDGGGVHIQAGAATLHDLVAVANSAGARGGAVYYAGRASTVQAGAGLRASQVVFGQNAAEELGAALFIVPLDGAVLLEHMLFAAGQIFTSQGAGAGLACQINPSAIGDASVARMSNITAAWNTAWHGYGAGMAFSGCNNVHLHEVRLIGNAAECDPVRQGNTACSGYGAGMALQPNSTVRIYAPLTARYNEARESSQPSGSHPASSTGMAQNGGAISVIKGTLFLQLDPSAPSYIDDGVASEGAGIAVESKGTLNITGPGRLYFQRNYAQAAGGLLVTDAKSTAFSDNAAELIFFRNYVDATHGISVRRRSPSTLGGSGVAVVNRAYLRIFNSAWMFRENGIKHRTINHGINWAVSDGSDLIVSASLMVVTGDPPFGTDHRMCGSSLGGAATAHVVSGSVLHTYNMSTADGGPGVCLESRGHLYMENSQSVNEKLNAKHFATLAAASTSVITVNGRAGRDKVGVQHLDPRLLSAYQSYLPHAAEALVNTSLAYPGVVMLTLDCTSLTFGAAGKIWTSSTLNVTDPATPDLPPIPGIPMAYPPVLAALNCQSGLGLTNEGAGGALSSNVQSAMYLHGVALINNSCPALGGGAIYASRIEVKRSVLMRNTAYLAGGAIYMTPMRSCSLEDVLFEDNLAGARGGALYGISGSVDMVNVKFKRNFAGALRLADMPLPSPHVPAFAEELLRAHGVVQNGKVDMELVPGCESKMLPSLLSRGSYFPTISGGGACALSQQSFVSMSMLNLEQNIAVGMRGAGLLIDTFQSNNILLAGVLASQNMILSDYNRFLSKNPAGSIIQSKYQEPARTEPYLGGAIELTDVRRTMVLSVAALSAMQSKPVPDHLRNVTVDWAGDAIRALQLSAAHADALGNAESRAIIQQDLNRTLSLPNPGFHVGLLMQGNAVHGPRPDTDMVALQFDGGQCSDVLVGGGALAFSSGALLLSPDQMAHMPYGDRARPASGALRLDAVQPPSSYADPLGEIMLSSAGSLRWGMGTSMSSVLRSWVAGNSTPPWSINIAADNSVQSNCVASQVRGGSVLVYEGSLQAARFHILGNSAPSAAAINLEAGMADPGCEYAATTRLAYSEVTGNRAPCRYAGLRVKQLTSFSARSHIGASLCSTAQVPAGIELFESHVRGNEASFAAGADATCDEGSGVIYALNGGTREDMCSGEQPPLHVKPLLEWSAAGMASLDGSATTRYVLQAASRPPEVLQPDGQVCCGGEAQPCFGITRAQAQAGVARLLLYPGVYSVPEENEVNTSVAVNGASQALTLEALHQQGVPVTVQHSGRDASSIVTVESQLQAALSPLTALGRAACGGASGAGMDLAQALPGPAGANGLTIADVLPACAAQGSASLARERVFVNGSHYHGVALQQHMWALADAAPTSVQVLVHPRYGLLQSRAGVRQVLRDIDIVALDDVGAGPSSQPVVTDPALLDCAAGADESAARSVLGGLWLADDDSAGATVRAVTGDSQLADVLLEQVSVTAVQGTTLARGPITSVDYSGCDEQQDALKVQALVRAQQCVVSMRRSIAVGVQLRGNAAAASPAFLLYGAGSALYANQSVLAHTAAQDCPAVFAAQDAQVGLAHTTQFASEATAGGGAAICAVQSLVALQRWSAWDMQGVQSGALSISSKSRMMLVPGTAAWGARLLNAHASEGRGGALSVARASLEAHAALPGSVSLTVAHSSAAAGGALGVHTDGEARVLRGGAIHADNCSATGPDGGGALYLLQSSWTSASSRPDALLLDSCSAQTGGGAAVSFASMDLAGCTVRHNRALDGAGGGLVTTASTLRLASCSITDNIAQGDGGGLATRSADEVHVASSTFVRNLASSGAGMAVQVPISLRVDNVSWLENRAVSGSGGGLQLQSSSGAVLELALITAAGNSASVSGGAVALQGTSTLQLESSAYAEAALRYASAARQQPLASTSVLRVSHSSFADNSAAAGGGAVSCAAGALVLENVSVATCHAQQGGAIQLDAGCGAVLSGARLLQNQADMTGHDVHVTEGATLLAAQLHSAQAGGNSAALPACDCAGSPCAEPSSTCDRSVAGRWAEPHAPGALYWQVAASAQAILQCSRVEYATGAGLVVHSVGNDASQPGDAALLGAWDAATCPSHAALAQLDASLQSAQAGHLHWAASTLQSSAVALHGTQASAARMRLPLDVLWRVYPPVHAPGLPAPAPNTSQSLAILGEPAAARLTPGARHPDAGIQTDALSAPTLSVQDVRGNAVLGTQQHPLPRVQLAAWGSSSKLSGNLFRELDPVSGTAKLQNLVFFAGSGKAALVSVAVSTVQPATSVSVQLQPCPPGSGLSSAGTCAPCSPGTASAMYGWQPCSPCLPGTASSSNATRCTLCQPGTFSISAGSSQCGMCPRQQFSSATSQLYQRADLAFTASDNASLSMADQLPSACQACPSRGVHCAVGRLYLEDGWYFAELAGRSLDLQALRTLQTATDESELALVWKRLEGATPHRCWKPYACEVEDQGLVLKCTQGMTGPTCGACDWANGYVRSGMHCVQCPAQVFINLGVAFIVLVMLFVVVYYTVYADFSTNSPRKVLMRLALNYGQLLALTGKVRTNGLPLLDGLFSAALTFTAAISDVPWVSCALQGSFYQRFTMTLASPFALCAACVVVQLVWLGLVRRVCSCCRPAPDADVVMSAAAVDRLNVQAGHNPMAARARRESLGSAWTGAGKTRMSRAYQLRKQSARSLKAIRTMAESASTAALVIPAHLESWDQWKRRRAWVAPLLFFTYTVFPTLATTVMSAFSCTEEIGGHQYLRADLSVQCYTREYFSMLGVAIGFLVLCLLTPFVLTWTLRSHADSFESPAVRATVGFLIDGYRTAAQPYWEGSAVLVRKLALACATVVVAVPELQSVTALMVLALALTAHVVVQPFAMRIHNIMETCVLLAVWLTIIAALTSQLLEEAKRTPGATFDGVEPFFYMVSVSAFSLHIVLISCFVLLALKPDFMFRFERRQEAPVVVLPSVEAVDRTASAGKLLAPDAAGTSDVPDTSQLVPSASLGTQANPLAGSRAGMAGKPGARRMSVRTRTRVASSARQRPSLEPIADIAESAAAGISPPAAPPRAPSAPPSPVRSATPAPAPRSPVQTALSAIVNTAPPPPPPSAASPRTNRLAGTDGLPRVPPPAPALLGSNMSSAQSSASPRLRPSAPPSAPPSVSAAAPPGSPARAPPIVLRSEAAKPQHAEDDAMAFVSKLASTGRRASSREAPAVGSALRAPRTNPLLSSLPAPPSGPPPSFTLQDSSLAGLSSFAPTRAHRASMRPGGTLRANPLAPHRRKQ